MPPERDVRATGSAKNWIDRTLRKLAVVEASRSDSTGPANDFPTPHGYHASYGHSAGCCPSAFGGFNRNDRNDWNDIHPSINSGYPFINSAYPFIDSDYPFIDSDYPFIDSGYPVYGPYCPDDAVAPAFACCESAFACCESAFACCESNFAYCESDCQPTSSGANVPACEGYWNHWCRVDEADNTYNGDTDAFEPAVRLGWRIIHFHGTRWIGRRDSYAQASLRYATGSRGGPAHYTGTSGAAHRTLG